MNKVLGVVAILALILVGVVMTRPDSYRVERSIVINAPADVVLAQATDMEKSTKWSPWDKIDPNMTREVFGEPNTVGHGYSWSGNKDAGSGELKIASIDPGHEVVQDLHFKEPFEDNAQAGVTVEPVEGGTKTTWWMAGNNNFMGKVFGLFMDMDKMIGDKYEEGLAMLKTQAEEEARIAAEAARKAEEEAAAAAAAAAALGSADPPSALTVEPVAN